MDIDHSAGPLGAPKNPTAGPVPSQNQYRYLGAKQRQTTTSTGAIEMGARVYVPQLGRFLQADPIYGGSANPYDYANQDPLNQMDLAGTCSSKTAHGWNLSSITHPACWYRAMKDDLTGQHGKAWQVLSNIAVMGTAGRVLSWGGRALAKTHWGRALSNAVHGYHAMSSYTNTAPTAVQYFLRVANAIYHVIKGSPYGR